MTKTKKPQKPKKTRLIEYLQLFKPREDIIRFEGPLARKTNVSWNDGAYEDLEIGSVLDSVLDYVPFLTHEGEKYVKRLFYNPLSDKAVLEEKQDVIEELFYTDSLDSKVSQIKKAADSFKYDRRFEQDYADKKVQNLENARLLVNLVDVINENLDSPSSIRLQKVKEFGQKMAGEEGFQKVKNFIKQSYGQIELGEILATMRYDFRRDNLSRISQRRNFYVGANLLAETLERVLEEDGLKGFLNNEAEGVKLLNTIRKKTEFFNDELFKFEEGLGDFQGRQNQYFTDLTEYWFDLVNESINSKLPIADIGGMPEELGFYLGIVGLQKEWSEKGIPVERPKFFEKEERKAEVIGSYNTTLVKYMDGVKPVPNDVISDPKRNLFIVTGPNNGGKTTYLRQVGQQYWLAHLGMFLPAEKAEMSVVDGIYTSFSGEDDTKAGTGQYLTELERISKFINPENGDMHITPYSLLFFDEFANGTDHEESVYRTKVVLEYINKKRVTAYFTTHKQEIADLVDAGELVGSMNLASAVKQNGDGIEATHRIIRDAREESYGYLQAESMGITPEELQKSIEREIKQGLYPLEHTRIENLQDGIIVKKIEDEK